jgi:hypothetical protein
MKRTLVTIVLAGILLLAAAASAAAATPAAYKASLNGLCRSYTPKFKLLETRMTRAVRAKDAHAYGLYLGAYLALGLQQDVRIERTPVPAALRALMSPILRTLRAADTHLRGAIAAARRGDDKGISLELTRAAKVAAPLNRMLDAAGLRDCGSNQS